jgi:serine/threonine protein kinase
MTIGNLGTKLFSESNDLLGGTLSWMSPELMNASRADSKNRATCESDCYALGMVIYEVSRSRLLLEWPPIDLSRF